jgi:hypothetical protein
MIPKLYINSTARPAKTSIVALLWGQKDTLLSKPTLNIKEDGVIGDRSEMSMCDSFCEALFPFKSSPALLEDYINAYGGIR